MNIKTGFLNSYRNKNTYSIDKFKEDLKTYINNCLKSEEIEQIDLSNLIFPKRLIFDFGDYLEKDKICSKPFIARNTVFSGSAIFSDVKFFSEVNFENTAFYSRAIFSNTEFFSEVDFIGVNFHRQVNFFRAIFQEDSKVTFNHSKFQESAYFNESRFLSSQECIFEYSSFQRSATFNSACFDAKTIFSEVIFFENCNFNKIIAKKKIDFNTTKFRGETKFIKAEINNEINFSKISINNLFLFKNLILDRFAKIKISEVLSIKESSKIIITDIDCSLFKSSPENQTNQKEEIFEFNSLNFFSREPVIVIRNYNQLHKIKLFKFQNCFLETGTVLLENCNLTYMHSLIQADPIIFDGFLFKHCELPKEECPSSFIPNLIKVKTIDGFLEKKSFLKKFFYNLKNLNPKSKRKNRYQKRLRLLEVIRYQRIKLARHRKEKYAVLKTIALGEGEKQLSFDFFFNQMYWASLEKKNFINSFYYLTCGYGLSWFKPLVFYLLLLFLFTGFYFFLISFVLIDQLELPKDLKDLKILENLDALYSSFTISLLGSSPVPIDFFAGQVLMHSGVKISAFSYISVFSLYIPQKVMQIFLLFELGSAIRNKVQR